jgi:hypothetical protein
MHEVILKLLHEDIVLIFREENNLFLDGHLTINPSMEHHVKEIAPGMYIEDFGILWHHEMFGDLADLLHCLSIFIHRRLLFV